MASNWDDEELDGDSGKGALSIKDSWDDEDEQQSLTSRKETGITVSSGLSSGNSGSSRSGKDSSTLSSKKEKQLPTTTKGHKATEDRLKDTTSKPVFQESPISDPLERKLELERLVKEADIENTKDLFIGKGVSSLSISPSHVGSMDSRKSPNLTEFEEFKHAVLEKLKGLKNQPDYLNFLQNFVRDLASDLPIEDIKELTKVLTVISNEKLRAEKDSKTKKKPATSKKVTLKAESGLDYTNYGDVADDFDDFM